MISDQAAADTTGSDAEPRRRLFIVSVHEAESGEVRGVVEAVRTRWKERFEGLDDLGRIVGGMLRRLGTGVPHPDESGRTTR